MDEIVLKDTRSEILESLKDNRIRIAMLNADAEKKIKEHEAEIQKLRALQKKFNSARIKRSWLLSLLIKLSK